MNVLTRGITLKDEGHHFHLTLVLCQLKLNRVVQIHEWYQSIGTINIRIDLLTSIENTFLPRTIELGEEVALAVKYKNHSFNQTK